MSWDPSQPERRKSYCPICKDRRAKPTSVTEGAGRKIIALECEQCGFQWEVEQQVFTPAT
jgi:hypothetical protein